MLDPGAALQTDIHRQPQPLLRTMIGDALRRTRLEQRRTLADVARAARVSMPYLSEVERGRKEASSEVLAAVCGALRLDLSDLLAEVERGLIEFRGRRARRDRMVRLGVIGGRAGLPDSGRPAGPPGSGSGSAQCLLAA